MEKIIILFNFIIIAVVSVNIFLFGRLYLKSKDRTYYHFLVLYISIIFTVLLLFILFLLKEEFQSFIRKDMFYNLLYSYIIFGYCMIIFSVLSFFLYIHEFSVSNIIRDIIITIIFSPVIIVFIFILIKSDTERFILVKNILSIIMLLFLLFFSLYSIIGIKKMQIKNKKLVLLVSIFSLLYLFFGIFDGIQEKIDFITLPEGFSFSSVFILVFSVFSILIGLKYDNKSQISNDIFFKTLDREKMYKFKISEREEEIVKKIIEGKTNKEIAHELFISLSTVRTHIYNIFQKTGAKNRIDVINILST